MRTSVYVALLNPSQSEIKRTDINAYSSAHINNVPYKKKNQVNGESLLSIFLSS